MLHQKANRLALWALLGLTFLVAVALRAWGIHWGIPSSSIPHRAFHPDEWWAMNVMQQMNLEAGDFNPEEAHREGPVCYYFWFFIFVVAQKIGFLSHLPYQTPSEGDEYARCLLLGRWVVVILDSLSILPLFLSVKELTKRTLPAFVAAIFLAVCPFEVIYGRYMRTHAPANLLVCLVFWHCAVSQQQRSRKWEALAGILSGLSATIRYPTGAVIFIPGLILLREEWRRLRAEFPESLKRFRGIACSRKLWILVGSFVITVLLSAPHIVTDFWGVLPHIRYQASFAKAEEFGPFEIFRFQRLLPYFTFLLPFGLFPGLWIPAYLAVFYLLKTRAYSHFTIPVAAFLLVYSYGMAKGYLAIDPEFVRAIMPLFPGVALLVGLATAHLFETYRSSRFQKLFLAVLLAFLLPSVYFDAQYSLALNREDPRLQVYHYLEQTASTRPIRVGVPPLETNYFLATPVLSKISRDHLILEERLSLGKDPQDLEFVVLTKFGRRSSPGFNRKMASLKNSRTFRFERKFENPLTIFGKTFDSENLPHDMSYPFPEYYIFRRVK